MEIIKKHLVLKEKLKNNYNFNTFLGYLDDDELLNVLELILTSDIKFLNLFFQSYRNVDKDEIAFDSLFEQPYTIIRKISEKLNTIFQRALKKLYGEKSLEVIDKIITFSSMDRGLTNTYIHNVINDNSVDADIKIRLLFLLKTRKQRTILKEFFENYQIDENPHLIPFIIKYVARKNINTTIEYLLKLEIINPIPPSNSIKNWYYSIIYDLVSDSNKRNQFEIIKTLQSIKLDWIKSIFEQIIDRHEFINILLCVNMISNDSIDERKEINKSLNFIKKANEAYLINSVTKSDAVRLKRIIRKHGFLLPNIMPELRSIIMMIESSPDYDFYSFISEKIKSIDSYEKLSATLMENIYPN